MLIQTSRAAHYLWQCVCPYHSYPVTSEGRSDLRFVLVGLGASMGRAEDVRSQKKGRRTHCTTYNNEHSTAHGFYCEYTCVKDDGGESRNAHTHGSIVLGRRGHNSLSPREHCHSPSVLHCSPLLYIALYRAAKQRPDCHYQETTWLSQEWFIIEWGYRNTFWDMKDGRAAVFLFRYSVCILPACSGTDVKYTFLFCEANNYWKSYRFSFVLVFYCICFK